MITGMKSIVAQYFRSYVSFLSILEVPFI